MFREKHIIHNLELQGRNILYASGRRKVLRLCHIHESLILISMPLLQG